MGGAVVSPKQTCDTRSAGFSGAIDSAFRPPETVPSRHEEDHKMTGVSKLFLRSRRPGLIFPDRGHLQPRDDGARRSLDWQYLQPGHDDVERPDLQPGYDAYVYSGRFPRFERIGASSRVNSSLRAIQCVPSRGDSESRPRASRHVSQAPRHGTNSAPPCTGYPKSSADSG